MAAKRSRIGQTSTRARSATGPESAIPSKNPPTAADVHALRQPGDEEQHAHVLSTSTSSDSCQTARLKVERHRQVLQDKQREQRPGVSGC